MLYTIELSEPLFVTNESCCTDPRYLCKKCAGRAVAQRMGAANAAAEFEGATARVAALVNNCPAHALTENESRDTLDLTAAREALVVNTPPHFNASPALMRYVANQQQLDAIRDETAQRDAAAQYQRERTAAAMAGSSFGGRFFR